MRVIIRHEDYPRLEALFQGDDLVLEKRGRILYGYWLVTTALRTNPSLLNSGEMWRVIEYYGTEKDDLNLVKSLYETYTLFERVLESL